MPASTTCVACRVPLHMVAAPGDEWAWADPGGSTSGTDPDLAHLYDPAANPLGAVNPWDALKRMSDALLAAHAVKRACLTWVHWRLAQEYSALKVRLDMGLPFHVHRPEASPAYDGPPPPEHCGWPMRLAPSGWRCRVCPA